MSTPEPGRTAAPSASASWGDDSSWRGARPELAVLVILVAVLTAGGYAFAGPAAATVVVLVAAVVCLGGLRLLAVPDQRAVQLDEQSAGAVPGSIAGFWRRRAELADGTQSHTAYDMYLRVTLQRLLAARLAERHGISLHDDPQAARRLLLAGRDDDRLWYWIDPSRPAEHDGRKPGIPPRTLAVLVDRLERL
ncbi:MAG TPA: hypothetical protein VGI64_16620 [Streptosporangiaceae bacterium]